MVDLVRHINGIYPIVAIFVEFTHGGKRVFHRNIIDKLPIIRGNMLIYGVVAQGGFVDIGQ